MKNLFMKSIIQGAVLVFLVAGKSFSRGAQFWRKYVIAPFCITCTGAPDDWREKKVKKSSATRVE